MFAYNLILKILEIKKKIMVKWLLIFHHIDICKYE